MNDNSQHIHLITAYLDGSITPGQRAKLNELIEQGEVDILNIKEMESLYQKLDQLPASEPSNEMTDRFYAMLEAEKQQQKPVAKDIVRSWVDAFRAQFTMPKLAAVTVVFLIGFLIGNWATPFQNYRQELSSLSTEVSQMREVMMMTLLDNNSATERLKAVNISSEIRTVDERITGALFKTLNNDPNVNVRLAAVESLIQHASAPMVRERLVASINEQQSPLVQAALADAMLTLQEKRSVDEFKQLLDQQELDPGVRDKLKNTIAALS